MLPNKACTSRVGFCGTCGEHFAKRGFEFFLLQAEPAYGTQQLKGERSWIQLQDKLRN
jgi:hypothetical protein